MSWNKSRIQSRFFFKSQIWCTAMLSYDKKCVFLRIAVVFPLQLYTVTINIPTILSLLREGLAFWVFSRFRPHAVSWGFSVLQLASVSSLMIYINIQIFVKLLRDYCDKSLLLCVLQMKWQKNRNKLSRYSLIYNIGSFRFRSDAVAATKFKN